LHGLTMWEGRGVIGIAAFAHDNKQTAEHLRQYLRQVNRKGHAVKHDLYINLAKLGGYWRRRADLNR